MESPSSPTLDTLAQQAPTVAGPPSSVLPPPALPAPPYIAPPSMPFGAPPAPPLRARRPVALGVIIVFAASLAIIGVVTNSLSAALAQARVIAYPQPNISIVFSETNQIARVGDQLHFSVNIQAGRDLSVNWDFGDGNSAQGTSVIYTYATFGNYVIQAMATDPLGQTASDSYTLQVLPQPPQAQFTITNDPSSPYIYNFDASDSTGGTALTYNWDFGDGQTENGDTTPITSHTYANTGTYQVTLTVMDQANQSSAPDTRAVVVSLPKPSASFTVQLDPYCSGYWYSVSVDASASTGYQLTYNWDFGDGTTDTGLTSPQDSYNYYVAGSYLITLTVTDPSGQSATASQWVTPC